MPRGRLITIEGIDGSGKTTLAAALQRALAARVGTSSSCASRGASSRPSASATWSRTRRSPLRPGRGTALRRRARPAGGRAAGPPAREGTWVLLDRFVDSSLAYQGAGRALGIEAVRAINLFATVGLEADRTLLLRIDPAAARARAAARGEAPDRLELEDEEFFARIAAGYDALARAEPKRLRVLDAAQSAEHVLAAALAAVGDLLAVRVREGSPRAGESERGGVSRRGWGAVCPWPWPSSAGGRGRARRWLRGSATGRRSGRRRAPGGRR